MRDTIKRLRELEAAATPGPWVFKTHPNPGTHITTTPEQEGWTDRCSYRIEPPGYGGIRTVCDDELYYNSAPNITDAALIAEMRNALPKLLAVVETGRRLVESAITQADILADGSIVPTKCSVDPEEFDKFQDALAALEDKTINESSIVDEHTALSQEIAKDLGEEY